MMARWSDRLLGHPRHYTILSAHRLLTTPDCSRSAVSLSSSDSAHQAVTQCCTVCCQLHTTRMESPPSSQWATALGLLAVAALWGCTNPLLNKASQGMEQRPASSPAVLASSSAATTSAPRSLLRRLACDTAYLLTNWRFLLPFAINQAGSALFLVALGHAGQWRGGWAQLQRGGKAL